MSQNKDKHGAKIARSPDLDARHSDQVFRSPLLNSKSHYIGKSDKSPSSRITGTFPLYSGQINNSSKVMSKSSKIRDKNGSVRSMTNPNGNEYSSHKASGTYGNELAILAVGNEVIKNDKRVSAGMAHHNEAWFEVQHKNKQK